MNVDISDVTVDNTHPENGFYITIQYWLADALLVDITNIYVNTHYLELEKQKEICFNI